MNYLIVFVFPTRCIEMVWNTVENTVTGCCQDDIEVMHSKCSDTLWWVFFQFDEESLELFERSQVVLEPYPQVKVCLVELGQWLFGPGHLSEVAHPIPRHGYRFQVSLVLLSNPSSLSCILSLRDQLHRILAQLPGDMLLSSTASFHLLDLAWFLLYLQVWALLVVWPRCCSSALVSLFSLICYKILGGFWELGSQQSCWSWKESPCSPSHQPLNWRGIEPFGWSIPPVE